MLGYKVSELKECAILSIPGFDNRTFFGTIYLLGEDEEAELTLKFSALPRWVCQSRPLNADVQLFEK
jgi:hypothetical protein